MALSIFSSVQHPKVGQLITGVNLNSLVHTGKCGKAPLENSDIPFSPPHIHPLRTPRTASLEGSYKLKGQLYGQNNSIGKMKI